MVEGGGLVVLAHKVVDGQRRRSSGLRGGGGDDGRSGGGRFPAHRGALVHASRGAPACFSFVGVLVWVLHLALNENKDKCAGVFFLFLFDFFFLVDFCSSKNLC